MPQTRLQIVNSALIKIGGRELTAFPTDTTGTKESRLVFLRHAACRDMLIRGHTWAFLKGIVTLTATGTTTIHPWSQIHDIPDDCARILEITSSLRCPLAYERAGNQIYTTEETVVLRYVKNFVTTAEDDSTEYPDDFAEVLAAYLAADICVSLTDDEDMRDRMLRLYGDLLRTARHNGAVERSADSFTATAWLDSRFLNPPEDRAHYPLDI